VGLVGSAPAEFVLNAADCAIVGRIASVEKRAAEAVLPGKPAGNVAELSRKVLMHI
jgi:hypothetical protein